MDDCSATSSDAVRTVQKPSWCRSWGESQHAERGRSREAEKAARRKRSSARAGGLSAQEKALHRRLTAAQARTARPRPTFAAANPPDASTRRRARTPQASIKDEILVELDRIQGTARREHDRADPGAAEDQLKRAEEMFQTSFEIAAGRQDGVQRKRSSSPSKPGSLEIQAAHQRGSIPASPGSPAVKPFGPTR